jgi:hypothetical protein
MMLSALASPDSYKLQEQEAYFGLSMLAVDRWTDLARQAVASPKKDYVFILPKVSARQTFTTGAQMRKEKVLSFASAIPLDEDALREAAKLVRVRIELHARATGSRSAQRIDARADQVEIPVWLTNLERGESQVSDVAATIEGLFRDLDARGLEPVNEELARIDVVRANHVHLVAVLRALFLSRGKLSNWKVLRERTHQLLAERGRNADKVMAGLNAG